MKKIETNAKIFHPQGLENQYSLNVYTTQRLNSDPQISMQWPSKFQWYFLTEVEKKSYNLYGTTKDLNSKAILSEKNKAGGITLLDFRESFGLQGDQTNQS